MLNFNTNLQSLLVRRSLQHSTNILNQAIERMSTGMKINSAKDNAAGYAIANQMTTQLSSLDVIEDNTSMGLDLVMTANDTLDLINSRFTRLRDLAMQAENETHGEEALKAINVECQSLVEEIKTLTRQAEFEGMKIYGAEFLETIQTNATAPIDIQTFDLNPTESYADASTTLQQLGIDESSFQIYNSNGSLIESYETEKADTLQDVFNVLSTYGFTSSITDGVVSISSTNGRYVDGDLMRALGIELDATDFVANSTQNSTSNLYYTVTQTASEASTLGEIGVLPSGNDIITINNKYGDKVTDIGVSSSTTLGGLFNLLGNYDIQGEVDDGVITLSSSIGNYVVSQGVIANLGIGISESSSAVTTGTSQTSSGAVVYETVTTTGGEVTTTQQEQTITLWTTTTTSETVTNTIWTTTTTSETQSETLTVTTTVAITDTTTFGELGMDTEKNAEVRDTYINTVIAIITITPETSIGEFRSVLATYSIGTELTNGKFYFDGLNSKNPNSNSDYYLFGDIVDFLGIGSRTVSVQQTSSLAALTDEIIIENNTTVTGTNTVIAGDFKQEVVRTDYTDLVAISSLADGATLTAGTSYAISTAEDLVRLASMKIKGGISKNLSLVLTNDIDMSGINWTTGIDLIGDNPSIHGRLTFDGNGYKIFNLTGSCGLFDSIDWAKVKNLGLVDVNITSTSGTVGGLVKDLNGSMDNCFVTGTIIASGSFASVGGLAAISSYRCTITQTYTSIDMVIKGATEVGGLIGHDQYGVTINDCYVEGSINYSNELYYNTICVGGVIGMVQDANSSGISKCDLTSVISACTILINIDNNKEGGIGGIIGKCHSNGDYADMDLSINNISFIGDITDNSSNGNVGLLAGIFELKKTCNFEISDIYNGSTLLNTLSKTTFLGDDDTLAELGITSGNIGIQYADGSKRTIAIDATKTISQTRKDLEQYGIQTVLSDGNLNFYLNRVGASFCSVTNASNIANWSKKKVSRTLKNGPCNAYREMQTETVNTTTISTTTTTSTTETETVNVTTTTSTTQTEMVDVVTTTPVIYTTANTSMTADTTFSQLGLSSRAYVTVMQNNTQKIITVKTADTVASLVTKLNNVGIDTTLNNGQLTITPSSKGIYISGMSDALKNALELNSDFYTSSLGVEMTDSSTFIYDAATTIRNSTSLSEIGVTSGELVIKKDGNDDITIAVVETQSVGDLVQQLQNAGFNASCSNGALRLNASGDMYLASANTNSSNAVTVLGLGDVQQTIDRTYANTNSEQLETLSEIIDYVWHSSSAITLQIGTNNDTHSRLEISTGFDLGNIDRFKNIGKKTVSNVNYIEELDNIISNISMKQVELGASENRLESVLEEVAIKYDNLVSSRSTIRDADLAEESSRYIQSQILQQASATLLSVANQSPQLALQLL